MTRSRVMTCDPPYKGSRVTGHRSHQSRSRQPNPSLSGVGGRRCAETPCARACAIRDAGGISQSLASQHRRGPVVAAGACSHRVSAGGEPAGQGCGVSLVLRRAGLLLVVDLRNRSHEPSSGTSCRHWAQRGRIMLRFHGTSSKTVQRPVVSAGRVAVVVDGVADAGRYADPTVSASGVPPCSASVGVRRSSRRRSCDHGSAEAAVVTTVHVVGPCRRCGRVMVKTRSLATGKPVVLEVEPTSDGTWRLDSHGYATRAHHGCAGLPVHVCGQVVPGGR